MRLNFLSCFFGNAWLSAVLMSLLFFITSHVLSSLVSVFVVISHPFLLLFVCMHLFLLCHFYCCSFVVNSFVVLCCCYFPLLSVGTFCWCLVVSIGFDYYPLLWSFLICQWFLPFWSVGALCCQYFPFLLLCQCCSLS